MKVFSQYINTTRDRFQQRVVRWAHKRQGDDGAVITLHRRRIYILPTRQGMMFGLVVFLMLLGSMNYSNSMGFLMTFFLGALGVVAMHNTHRNLEGLIIRRGRAEAVFAGNEAIFEIIVENPSRQPRDGITITLYGKPMSRTDLAAGGIQALDYRMTAEKRGWLQAERFGVHTTWPFGLFKAWAWIYMPHPLLVYPEPASNPPAPPLRSAEQGESRASDGGQGDFSGLRDYRKGDAPRHVAWKASARLDKKLLVKEFKDGNAVSRDFDFESLPAHDIESRLSILTRWILDAESAGERYALLLPNERIPLGQGGVHRDRCLKALALFDGGAK